MFDSSLKPGREPFRFTVGAKQVIEGWDQGLMGMKVGEKRKLTIPPKLGYGDKDMGVIPSNSTLIFEVELLEVEQSHREESNLRPTHYECVALPTELRWR